MTIYKLLENVYLVRGALRGALCDIQTGNVFSINEFACQVINGEKSDEQFWQKLVELGLAETTDKPQLPKLPVPHEIKLDFMWLEIVSDNCNLHCVHCYSDSMPPTSRATLYHDDDSQIIPLQVRRSLRPHMTFDHWINVLQEGYELGCRRIQFIGGEPLLYQGEKHESVLDLATIARSIGYGYIEIFTNGALLTRDKVNKIRELNLRMAVSLYSSDPKIHDQITGVPGSHAKTITGINMLREADIKTRVATTLLRANERNLPENTSHSCQNVVFQQPDPIRPVGRGNQINLRPSLEQEIKYGYLLEPDFTTDPKTFSRNFSGNNCLAGRVAINEHGMVTPCIFSRFQTVANFLQSGSLEKAINSYMMQTIWHQTKDKIMVCQDCEYRYVCTDCRPLAEAANIDSAEYLTAPDPRCTYNPYTGEWAKGAWRLSTTNEPYYDTSLELLIQHVLQSLNT